MTATAYELINPATAEPIRTVPVHGAAEVDMAVRAAAAAQPVWQAMPASGRAALMRRWAELIVRDAGALAAMDTACMGKPVRDSSREVPAAAGRLRYWSSMSLRVAGEYLPVLPGQLSFTVREPLGVVGVILPWNGPTAGFMERAAAGIGCGNAVVIKPSEYTPLSALRLVDLAVEAGLPPDLVSTVTGDGSTGAALVAHPGVDGVSFTGSPEAGARVGAQAASTFKKVVLELGGKSATIVFADADLDRAARAAAWSVFFNSGQVCCAGTRLLVHRSVAEEFQQRLLALTARLRVGDPTDPGTHLGPLVSAAQYDRVRGYLQDGRDEGARVLAGGGRPEGVDPRGYFVEPTVLAGLDPGMRVCREEIFGPVLAVQEFGDEGEAVELANGVEYGLSAGVWTRDAALALRMGASLRVGNVWCNTGRASHPALPFGGFKRSGVGNASGAGAVEANTRLKAVTVCHDEAAVTPGWDDL